MSTTRTFALARGIRLLALAALGFSALLALSSAARPATGHTARAGKAAFSFAVPAMLTPGIVGTAYPPKPSPSVSFCRPAPKPGAPCGKYTFKLSKQGKPPPGLNLGAQDGRLTGTPAWLSDLAQPTGSTAPGLFPFAVCAKEGAKGKTICKKTKLAVFSGFAGTWVGDYSGDSGAFTCTNPLSGAVKLVLTQKVTFTKGVPKSTVGGTVTFSGLPPISPDGVQTGDCKMSDQSFGLTGAVTNPGVAGPNAANGLWTGNIDAEGTLIGTMTIQDTGNNGFYSELSFTAKQKA